MLKNKKKINKSKPALEIIQQIKNGKIDPQVLDTETKICCTELLAVDGYTQAQIALILKMSDRTIRRYFIKIRRRNAQDIAPEFVNEFIGGLMVRARNNCDRLIRLSMNAEAKASEKISAALTAWRIDNELSKILIQLDYLASTSRWYGGSSKKDKLPFPPPVIKFISIDPKNPQKEEEEGEKKEE